MASFVACFSLIKVHNGQFQGMVSSNKDSKWPVSRRVFFLIKIQNGQFQGVVSSCKDS